MAVASVNASMPYQSASLVSNLKANGLTADKANLAAADVQGAIQQVGMVQRGPANKAAITEALQQRISADVASGKLSTSDAAAVYKTFEQMDPAKQNGGAGGPSPPDGSAPPPSKGAGGPTGGGADGAGQDSSTKVRRGRPPRLHPASRRVSSPLAAVDRRPCAIPPSPIWRLPGRRPCR